VPSAALMISLFTLDFALSAGAAALPGAGPGGIAALLATWHGWRLVADLFLVSVAGGIYALPLYTIIQARAERRNRARMVAANNVMNALFMAAGALATALLLAAGLPQTGLFMLLAGLNAGVALLTWAVNRG
jgi:hypothetical protein